MNCTWQDKSHKLCHGNCEGGCKRKLAEFNTDPMRSYNAWKEWFRQRDAKVDIIGGEDETQKEDSLR